MLSLVGCCYRAGVCATNLRPGVAEARMPAGKGGIGFQREVYPISQPRTRFSSACRSDPGRPRWSFVGSVSSAANGAHRAKFSLSTFSAVGALPASLAARCGMKWFRRKFAWCPASHPQRDFRLRACWKVRFAPGLCCSKMDLSPSASRLYRMRPCSMP